MRSLSIHIKILREIQRDGRHNRKYRCYLLKIGNYNIFVIFTMTPLNKSQRIIEISNCFPCLKFRHLCLRTKTMLWYTLSTPKTNVIQYSFADWSPATFHGDPYQGDCKMTPTMLTSRWLQRDSYQGYFKVTAKVTLPR